MPSRSQPHTRATSGPPAAPGPAVLRLAPHFFRPGRLPVAYDPVGGMQNQVWQSTRDLDRAGIRQTVVTTFLPGDERSYRLFATTTVECVGLSLPHRLAPALLSASWFVCMLPALAAWMRAHDVVHLHLNHSIWCRVLAIVAKRSGKPLLVTLNVSLLADGAAQDARAHRRPSWAERLEARALAAADRIVALTRRQRDAVSQLVPGTRERIRVIPDAIDAADFARPAAAEVLAGFRARHGIPAGRRVASYVGRISDEKGWSDLPAFVARLSRAGVFVLVCGDGPRRRRLEGMLDAGRRGVDWAVTGFVSREEVRAALEISDVVMLPSRREAFGSILLEAMSAGVPAVAYAVGGIVEVAGDSGAITLVPPDDTERFAAAVLALLEQPQLRETCVRRGLARVRQFTAADARDGLIHLYREVAPA